MKLFLPFFFLLHSIPTVVDDDQMGMGQRRDESTSPL